MKNNSEKGSGGVGFLGALTILFIGLKLGGVIDWSWLWVLSPLWIPWAFAITVFLVIGLVVGIAKVMKL